MSEKFEVKDGLKIPSGKQLELAGVSLSGITTDITLSGNSSDILPTESAVKGYVDANNQWTLSDGVSSTVVDTGNTLSISGTDNEVNVSVDQDADGFQIGLPASVEIETKLTTAELSATGTVTLADGATLATSAAPTNDAHIANKKYVDDQLGSTAMSAATDSGNMNPIDLDSETLTLTGGRGMDVTHEGNTVTFAAEIASATNLGGATFDETDFIVTAAGDVSLAKDTTITLGGDLSGSATMTNLADATLTATIIPNSVALATDTTGDYVADLTAGTGITSTGAVSGENISHTLSVDTAQNHVLSATSLSAVGALDSGSISSNFGNINNGTSTLNTGNASVGTLAAGNTTISGTISASGELTVGTVADGTSMATSAAPTDDAHIANKKYVDDQLGSTAMSGSADSGTINIDLDSEVFSIVGTANEISTAMSGNEVAISLPDDVTIGDALTITGETNCGDTLNMAGNNIEGTSENMLLQADDETSHTFTGTNKMALQALSGIEMVNNVKFSADIESNIIPDADSTRSLGDASNHWSAAYSDEVVLEHGKTTSFSVTPGSAAATAVMSFAHNSFKSAKVSMNVRSGDHYTAREVLIVCENDGSNPKFVEYGILSTDSELGTLSVATNGANVELRVASADALPCTGVVTLSE